MRNIAALIFVAAFVASSQAQFLRARSLRNDEPCGEPGYYRDSSDCTKFYRCAEHDTKIQGVTYITKSTYNCPAGTIFDESISTCNHYDMVQNRPAECQRPVLPEPSQSIDESQTGQAPPPSRYVNNFVTSHQRTPIIVGISGGHLNWLQPTPVLNYIQF